MKLRNTNIVEMTASQVEKACMTLIRSENPEIGEDSVICPKGKFADMEFEVTGLKEIVKSSPTAAVTYEPLPEFTKPEGGMTIFKVDDKVLFVDPACSIRVGKNLVTGFDPLPLSNMEPGSDYAIILRENGETFTTALDQIGKLDSTVRHIGGLHNDLGGKVLPNSMWDLKYRPAVMLPGLKLVNGRKGKFWDYIYLMGQDWLSRANVIPADGDEFTPKDYDNLNHHTASEIAKKLGMQLLSSEEFEDSMTGAKEGRVTKGKPKKTVRVDYLLSDSGSEMAFGALWVWLRSKTSGGYPMIAGGSCDDAGNSGPRYLNNFRADFSYVLVGARLRCDHLELD